MVILCTFLVIACYFDDRKGRIPNLLLVMLLAAGLLLGMLSGGLWGAMSYVGCSVLVMVALYPLFKLGCMGAGDVKLFGICSGFFPMGKILLFLFFSLLISAGVSLISLLKKHNLKERFCYLGEYLWEVFQSGHWKLYIEDAQKQKAGICLSGPILCSVLLYWGGGY